MWSRDVARWCRCGLSVAGPFVRRCLTSLTMLPFPHPAHRTGWADFPRPALGERFTMSPTGDGADIFVRDAVEHGAAFVLPRSCNYKSISVLLATWAPQDNSKIVV